MKPNEKTQCGFEQRELVGEDYWNDSRWNEVKQLRKEGKHPQANGIVSQIRESWGVD